MCLYMMNEFFSCRSRVCRLHYDCTQLAVFMLTRMLVFLSTWCTHITFFLFPVTFFNFNFIYWCLVEDWEFN